MKKDTSQLKSSFNMSFRIDKRYTNQYLFHCEKSHTSSYENSRINRNSTPDHKRLMFRALKFRDKSLELSF